MDEFKESLIYGLKHLTDAITPISALPGAVMGVTAGLVRIADAISDLAEAVRERESVD